MSGYYVLPPPLQYTLHAGSASCGASGVESGWKIVVSLMEIVWFPNAYVILVRQPSQSRATVGEENPIMSAANKRGIFFRWRSMMNRSCWFPEATLKITSENEYSSMVSPMITEFLLVGVSSRQFECCYIKLWEIPDATRGQYLEFKTIYVTSACGLRYALWLRGSGYGVQLT